MKKCLLYITAASLVAATSLTSINSWSNDVDIANLPVLKAMPIAYSSVSKNKLPDDVNGNGISDLFWFNAQTHQFSYWEMGYRKQQIASNPTDAKDVFGRVGWKIFSVTPGYQVGAVGDFSGNGLADLVWTSPAHDLYLWAKNQGEGYTSKYIGTYPDGWKLTGAGDVNGDGLADLLWYNAATCQFGYWIMREEQVIKTKAISVDCGYEIMGVSDLNQDHMLDIVWAEKAAGYKNFYVWYGNGDGFTSTYAGQYPYGPLNNIYSFGRFTPLGVTSAPSFDILTNSTVYGSVLNWGGIYDPSTPAPSGAFRGYGSWDWSLGMSSNLLPVSIGVSYFGPYRSTTANTTLNVNNPVIAMEPKDGSMLSSGKICVMGYYDNAFMRLVASCNPSVYDLSAYSADEVIPVDILPELSYPVGWKLIGAKPY